MSWKSAGDCTRNANTYLKLSYSGRARGVEKWSMFYDHHQKLMSSSDRCHNTKWNQLITFAVVVHTDRITNLRLGASNKDVVRAYNVLVCGILWKTARNARKSLNNSVNGGNSERKQTHEQRHCRERWRQPSESRRNLHCTLPQSPHTVCSHAPRHAPPDSSVSLPLPPSQTSVSVRIFVVFN